MPMTIRSRKVRRILRLESQADRQATREARATARAITLRRRVDTLRGEARALEASLSGGQRGELARVRAETGALVEPAPWRPHRAGDGPRGPIASAPLPAEPASRSRRRAVDGPNERAAHDPMTGSLDFVCPGLSREEV